MTKVKCPQCGKKTAWVPENAYKPFCCERCKLIDLGEWIMEEKVIPGDALSDELSSINDDN